MAFDTLDLGRIIETAQSIKNMRTKSADDELRRQYMQTQIAGAQQQQAQSDQQQKTQISAQEAKQHYLLNQAIETAPDPKAAAMQLAPEQVQQFEAAHGVDSFQQLTGDQVRKIASYAKQQAAAAAGINLQPSPEEQAKLTQARELAQMSASTSTANNAATNATSRANAQLSADTSRANTAATVGASVRGQDMTAETARRGQDLTNASNPSGAQNLDKTWNVYQQARSGLLNSLSGTVTGPVAGRSPAMTTAQQTADGGVSAMAPVMKQLFRAAGEGTFTDADQALLMKMIPTRVDTPEARQNKIQNIDNIVRAKLGKPVPEERKSVSGQNYLKIGGQWYQDDGT